MNETKEQLGDTAHVDISNNQITYMDYSYIDYENVGAFLTFTFSDDKLVMIEALVANSDDEMSDEQFIKELMSRFTNAYGECVQGSSDSLLTYIWETEESYIAIETFMGISFTVYYVAK